MNEQKYFDGLITGMKKVIELHKTKDDIKNLENELKAMRTKKARLEKQVDHYNKQAQDAIDLIQQGKFKSEYMPIEQEQEFKKLMMELINLQYISIVDVYNLDNTTLDFDLKIIIKAWYVVDLMQLSDLLDNNDNREIDLSKTRIKVINFMDNQYQQLKYLANTSPLQSVSYDNIKVQTSQNNSIEDKTIKQLQAKEYLRIIDDCINSLDDIKKTIFKGRIIKKLYYWQVEQISGYGKTRMYELLNLGCLEFAQKLKDMADIDLLEYKE